MGMTREEIIQGLQFTIDMFLLNPNTGETFTEPRNDMDKTTVDACRGAIKILEEELCDDAISRKKVIDTIYHECSCENLDIDFAKVLLLQRKIKALPPVQPKPKKGDWIVEDMYDGGVAYRCSVCGELFWIESGTPKDNEYNFCPKCGVMLVESHESEDKK